MKLLMSLLMSCCIFLSAEAIFDESKVFKAFYEGKTEDEILKLLNKKINVNEPLEKTAFAKYKKKEWSKDILKQCNTEETMLIWAVSKEYLRVVKTLLEKGADVNRADRYNRTPLWRASLIGNLEIVKLLIAHGADINRTDDYITHWSPLTAALIFRHNEVADYLKEHGAEEHDGAPARGYGFAV